MFINLFAQFITALFLLRINLRHRITRLYPFGDIVLNWCRKKGFTVLRYLLIFMLRYNLIISCDKNRLSLNCIFLFNLSIIMPAIFRYFAGFLLMVRSQVVIPSILIVWHRNNLIMLIDHLCICKHSRLLDGYRYEYGHKHWSTREIYDVVGSV